MDYNDLQMLVRGEISCDYFLMNNKQEITNYIESSRNNKPANVDYIDVLNPINRNELIALLNLYLEGLLLEWELEYVLNSLDGSDIEDERVESVIFSFANPYLNFHISGENAEIAIKYLSNQLLNLQLKGVNIKSKQKGKDYRPNYRSKILS
ncbi:hypothetical protein [Flagellimonas sp. C4]|uniref:hypothetical protein n=1 Tax=Flagellimonas alginolytica TaxID=3177515 RepID=UPI0035C8BA16